MQILLQLYGGDCKRFLCLAASYGKSWVFSTVLKQKQNFTLKERTPGTAISE